MRTGHGCFSMRKASFIFLLGLLVALISAAIAVFPTLAADPPGSPTDIRPGNYCDSCHSLGDPRLQATTQWRGPVEAASSNPCPAMKTISEELYYTERLLLMANEAENDVPGYLRSDAVETRLTTASENYSRLLDMPVTSLDAFVAEAQGMRYRLGKTYAQINSLIETGKRQRVFFFAALASLVMLVSLLWGWRNTRKALAAAAANRNEGALPQSDSRKTAWFFYAPRAAPVLVIFILFALPIFRVPAAETAAASDEELAFQARLDEASRAAGSADKAQARVWMLGQAALLKNDDAEGQAALTVAKQSALEAVLNQEALLGQAYTAQEAAFGQEISLEKAYLTSGDILASLSRAWGLRRLAESWTSVDQPVAAELLASALDQARDGAEIYRDLDLRSIAAAWARLDPFEGWKVTEEITDPAIRSWGQREIAALTGSADDFSAAAASARQVNDPIQRARLLREIGSASGNPSFYQEAAQVLEQAAVDEVDPIQLAYAWARLAGASGNSAWVERVDPAVPAARVLTFFQLESYAQAWEATGQIVDPMDQARAQAAVAAASGEAQMARQIAIPYLRDHALLEITQKTGDASLVQEIKLAYDQVRALTALGQYDSALETAAGLHDTYPLFDLALTWAKSDPQAGLALVDQLDREAEKAEVLRQVALETQDDAVFERALNMALAARVRGDVTAPVRASLALAVDFAGDPQSFIAAWQQAYEAAERISIK